MNAISPAHIKPPNLTTLVADMFLTWYHTVFPSKFTHRQLLF
jgi:hypothetical protein